MVMNWKGCGRKRSWRNLSGETEKNPAKNAAGLSLSGPRFEPETQELLSRPGSNNYTVAGKASVNDERIWGACNLENRRIF
jgi:hypothetical protein